VWENKIPIRKEDLAPAVRKKMVMDSDFALRTRMKKIHFERGVEDLRERPQFPGDQGRRIPVHGDHWPSGDEEQDGCRFNPAQSEIVRSFPKEIIERLASSMRK